jgi:hypothetical protein
VAQFATATEERMDGKSIFLFALWGPRLDVHAEGSKPMLFSASVDLRGRTSAGGGLMGQNFKLFQLLFGHKSNLVITMTLQSSLMDTRHSGKKFRLYHQG